ncbi:MAG: peptidoglycan DD-metalloendopeptidase family protein [Hyphomicrobiaceae bacterium]
MLRLSGPLRVSCLARTVGVGSAILSLAVAGCSADVSRFNAPMLGASDEASSRGGARVEGDRSIPLASAGPGVEYAPPPRSEQRFGAGPARSVTATDARPSDFRDETISSEATRDPPQRSYRLADAAPRGDERLPSNVAGEQQITVISGDTLYGLSRRHGISVGAIKSANGLTTDIIKPGQTLIIPGASSSTSLASRSPATRPRVSDPGVAVPTDAATGDTYTVQPGDSLYRISRETGVRTDDLIAMNGITDVRRLRPGTVLKLRETADVPEVVTVQRTQVVERVETLPSRAADAPSVGPRTEILNRPQGTPAARSDPSPGPAAAPQQTADAAPVVRPPATTQPSSRPDFRWPIVGRVISGFGPRADGSHNDGIDIDVPMGADVMATADGVVAYADSELKAYGNLILIRHDNGWVSAYAHADQLLVKRGDEVRRGQVIAKAGSTGSVTRPTLHFELRDGAKPVDPLPLLPRI